MSTVTRCDSEVTMGEGDQGFVKCPFLLHWIPSRAVSSPLFYLFGQSCHNRLHIVKYADDSVIVSFLSSDDTEWSCSDRFYGQGENHPF